MTLNPIIAIPVNVEDLAQIIYVPEHYGPKK